MRRSGISPTWQRVSKRRPCPVCEKPDWCLYAGDAGNPEAAICARIESPKRCGESGWLHLLRHDGPTWSPRVRRIKLSAARIATPALDLDKLAADCTAAVQPEALGRLAVALGVSVESLRRLGIGLVGKTSGLGISDEQRGRRRAGHPVATAQRQEVVDTRRHGRASSISRGHRHARAYCWFAEGPTDTAALLDLGFNAVGRPSCTGGVRLLVDLVRKHRPAGVVIVADGDAPGQTRRGISGGGMLPTRNRCGSLRHPRASRMRGTGSGAGRRLPTCKRRSTRPRFGSYGFRSHTRKAGT